ncbi:MAG: hypothetical protein IJY20_01020 [Clostridia bacterium]|nr:hypothetical protein [Clostridia bacterium]
MTQREQDLQVLRENFSLLDRRSIREVQKRLPLVSEFASLALTETEGEAREPWLNMMRRAAYELPKNETSVLQEPHRKSIETARETLYAMDRTAYINACLSMQEDAPDRLTLSDLLPMASYETARIAYVRNPYTDEAYESFADTFSSPTVHYTSSFREACDEVAAGEADFCILPYRNSTGRLASFSELAERYSLYICALCRVFHADGTDVTHFSLYGRHLPTPSDTEGLRLRFSFLAAGMNVLAGHLCAAAMMEVTLEDMRVVPYAANEGSLLCTATAAPPKDKLLPWLTYLSVFADGGVCHGLYKEI